MSCKRSRVTVTPDKEQRGDVRSDVLTSVYHSNICLIDLGTFNLPCCGNTFNLGRDHSGLQPFISKENIMQFLNPYVSGSTKMLSLTIC